MGDFSFSDPTVVHRLEAMYSAPDMTALRAHLLDKLAPQPGERILDVGCGPGVTLTEVALRVGARTKVTGIDVSEPMLQGARKRAASLGLQNVEVQTGDAEKLPFPDGSFDAVLCVQVLEYCKDPSRVLTEATRVLRPRGRVLFADTDWDTMVYNARDKELTRRIVAAWADHDSDGWLGRRLSPLFRSAGLRSSERSVYVVVNEQYHEPLMGWSLSRLAGDYVVKAGRVPRDQVELWFADLEDQHKAGQYYFSLNRYVCFGRK